jgi:PadR family transcriptional regulator PadR
LIEKGFTKPIILGFSKALVLWLLRIKPRYGYELMSEIQRLTGTALGPGLIYPLLHTLEKGDYIAGKWIVKAGRKVKHYSITGKGEVLLNKVRDIFGFPIKEMFLDLLK